MNFRSLSSSGSDPDEVQRRIAAIRRRHRPDNELPVTVAVDAVLLEGEDLVVFLSCIRVFSSGLELALLANSRKGDRGGLGSALFGHTDSKDRLLLGVEYADGRTADNLDLIGRHLDQAGDDELTPTLMSGNGGGSDRSAELWLYLCPLPPAGRLRIIAGWPGRGLQETVTEVSADRFLEASAGVRRLWDPDESEDLPGPPPPPNVPPGSWFDRQR